jgi:subtilase family serine protease
MFRSPLKLGALVFALLLAVPVLVAQSSKKPMLSMGPQAVPADITASNLAGADFGLFKCQIPGLSSQTCYDPFQIRHAYGVDNLVNNGFTGKGKTIVIIDAFQSPNIVEELNTFNQFYGLPGMNGLGAATDSSLGTFTQVAPDGLTPFAVGNGTQAGWAEEITLDVLWAHAMAPGANITLVLAKSSFDSDLLSATKYVVDNRLGDVISQSFGGNESCSDAATIMQQHDIFAEATRKNITLFASAGDFGSAQISCDGTQFVQAVSSPASDNLVTAVGGTELHAAGYCLTQLGCDPTQNPAAGTYDSEVVWNESAQPGGEATGGGFSVVVDEPAYQKATIKGKQRGLADVSYNAAVGHGVLTFLDIPGVTAPGGGFFLFGGTSAGAPQWAAIISILDQEAGRSLGFINKAVYLLGHSPAHSAFFHDVTSGNNGFLGVAGFSAAPGWDPPTGFGSPNIQSFVSQLPQFVSAGDGNAAINDSKPHGNPNAPGNGHKDAH